MGGRDKGKGKKLSRRRFLATSGAAGAAATLLPAHGALAATRGAPGAAVEATKGAAGAAGAKSSGAVLHGSPAVTELSSRMRSLQTADVVETSPFGRMFPSLPAHSPTDGALTALAGTMPGLPNVNPENPSVEAGITYLGQFIDHDVTFDEVSNLLGTNDPNGVHSTRTSRFDLDSLYGGGPDVSPQLYDPADPKKLLVIAKNEDVHDVPRDASGKAIIGDPRNDQHKIIVQLHVAFARFHNNVVGLLRSQGTTEDVVFGAAQQTVRWHYQWIVTHQFLPKIAGQEVVDQVLVLGEGGLPQVVTQFYQPVLGDPFMPVEFSVAAFRFGHSMIRPTYRINNSTGQQVPLFARLNGFTPVTASAKIFWGNFFHIAGSAITPQPAKKIDSHLTLPLGELASNITGDALMRNLAERNLRRGKSFGLPSGQSVAALIGAQVLSNEELGLTDPELGGEAPLWFYILKEAEIQTLGQRLGEVGGRIVTEVLLGMMAADPNSYLNVAPAFQPAPPLAATAGVFKISDLLVFAGVPI